MSINKKAAPGANWAASSTTFNAQNSTSEFHHWVIESCVESIKVYGIDPATKEQAAAHEAAHIVVAHAIGEKIKWARIEQQFMYGHVAWTGWNERSFHAYDISRPISVSDNPSLGFRHAVNNFAGFCGETLIYLGHPSSSIDERCRAWVICAELDNVFRLPEGTMAFRSGIACPVILNRNKSQFDAIRAHLEKHEKLSSEDATQLLVGVIPFDLTKIMAGEFQ